MIARIRTYRSSGSGHAWKDMDSYGRTAENSGELRPVQAALRFLEDRDPGDVFSVTAHDEYVTIYYRSYKW